ncbi:CHAT domain-containing protein [Kribbella sp. NPDC003557]|uniref:CHAT domain-containing protein n=1 Tax=Kribbella sp. NPDC003557 TaxID=3154449 RepID=UPI0033B9D550
MEDQLRRRDEVAAAGARRGGERIGFEREWDELLAEIRGLDGFSDFLRPPGMDQLRQAAAGGPVVVVNISRQRSDALIVEADGVRPAIPLPAAAYDVTADQAGRYLQVIHDLEAARRTAAEQQHPFEHGDLSAGAVHAYQAAAAALHAERIRTERVVLEVLEWLWTAIAEPVLTALGLTETPTGDTWPRLWWCPTGLLTAMPLHAAGRYSDGPTGRTVLDRVVPSYTPTVRALSEATSAPPSAAGRGILVVAAPDVPGQLPLPNVEREVELLTRLFPDSSTVLYGEAATTSAVLAELGRSPWVHFSCHGDQDVMDPSNGGLLLHDGMLTVHRITAGSYQGDLAFLSACKTATGGLHLPDEVITLAAAIHYAGYRQVIATLWSVYDPTAADVVEAVYTELTSDGQPNAHGAAQALYRVVRRLRDQYPTNPSVWMPFIHLGP